MFHRKGRYLGLRTRKGIGLRSQMLSLHIGGLKPLMTL